jgi:hypothetical protein
MTRITPPETCRRAAGHAALAAVLALGAACAHGTASLPPDSSARPGADVPDRFVPETPPPAGGTEATCRTPLVDPRDGARLVLYRSWEGARGDYQAPTGRYGVGERELLRVDCATGVPVGVVRR